MTVTRETQELTTVDTLRELTKLPEKLGANPATVAVTRREKPVLAIMTWEDYQAISDDEAIEQLRRSIKEVKEGKTIPWQQAKARLGA